MTTNDHSASLVTRTYVAEVSVRCTRLTLRAVDAMSNEGGGVVPRVCAFFHKLPFGLVVEPPEAVSFLP